MAYLEGRELEDLGIGRLGKNVRISTRAVLYDPHLMEIGDNVRVDDFCVLSGRIVLGRNVLITVFCNVAGGQVGITVGDFSGLAYGCHILSQTEDFSGHFLNNSTIPLEFRSETKKPVKIGRHCLVGTNSVILPGVNLAEGTAVYAMSMVTKSTMPWSIYFGIPAKRLKARSRQLLDHEAQIIASEQDQMRSSSG